MRVTNLVLMATMFVMGGCAVTNPDKVANSIPIVGSNLSKTDAFIQSAENGVKAAGSHTDAVGKAILAGVTDALKSAQVSNAAAVKELADVSKERDGLKTIASNALAAEAKYRDSWGYKAEVIIVNAATIILILVAVHFLCGIASGVVTFFPATAPAAPVLKLISTIVNPFGWFQFLVDHFHCPTCAPVVGNSPLGTGLL